MKDFFSIFRLKREANLLDSKIYIIKTFFSIITAYLIAKNNSILRLDMISVLFGLMLTLEPVSLTGIRGGVGQIYASLIGAISSAIIVYIGGINIITTALSIVFTLYICLKINWREVSPVAIFTAIYMTQYVQKTAAGEPSIILTFRLRIVALAFGVLIAILYNFIFSLISYEKMMKKRIDFLLGKVEDNINKTFECIKNYDKEQLLKLKNSLPDAFIDIDWIYTFVKDIKKEYKFISKLIGISQEKIEQLDVIIKRLRMITHYNYDISCIITEENIEYINKDNELKILYLVFEECRKDISIIKRVLADNEIDLEIRKNDYDKYRETVSDKKLERLITDVVEIIKNLHKIYTKIL